MNTRELRLALNTLPFLNSHATDPGGTLELRARPQRRLLVWQPEAVDRIFRSDARMLHRPSRTLSPLLGRRSLLWAQGQRHTAYRKLFGPPLRGRRLAGYRPIIADAVHSAIDATPAGAVFSLPEWTRRLTLRIIGRIVLDRADDTVLAPFTSWLDGALGSRSKTLVYRYLRGGLPRSGDDLDRMLLGSARSTVDSDPPTLAALLLTADGPLGGIDDDELRDQLVSLLFAGHETTASAIAWTLLWLDRDEPVRRDLIAELDATSDDGSNATHVPLLQAVAEESLRLSPPATLAGNRVTTEDSDLFGVPLPRGTELTPSIYLAHHHPDRFPHPFRFDPRRFLGKRVPSSHYFPFGGGIRRCLGSELAMLEIRMIIAALLRRRELRCVNPRAGTPRLRGPAMAPSGRLRVAVTACRD